jgi:hypothetical protein
VFCSWFDKLTTNGKLGYARSLLLKVEVINVNFVDIKVHLLVVDHVPKVLLESMNIFKKVYTQ